MEEEGEGEKKKSQAEFATATAGTVGLGESDGGDDDDGPATVRRNKSLLNYSFLKTKSWGKKRESEQGGGPSLLG